MPKYYKLSCDKYVFHVQVERKNTIVKVGNEDLACVTLELDHEDKSIILLDFFHHAQCAIDAELEKKEGTRMMLKASLTFARTLMSADRVSVQLQDESAFFYDKTRINVPLADRDLFIYGKTWYEQHIGFRIRPADKSQRSALERVLNARESIDFKRLYSRKGNDVYERDIRPFMIKHSLPSMKGVVWSGKFKDDLVDIKAVKAVKAVKTKQKRTVGGGVALPRPRMLIWSE